MKSRTCDELGLCQADIGSPRCSSCPEHGRLAVRHWLNEQVATAAAAPAGRGAAPAVPPLPPRPPAAERHPFAPGTIEHHARSEGACARAALVVGMLALAISLVLASGLAGYVLRLKGWL